MRVLTWNLMHGRAVPPAGRDLFEEFATALAGWEWDAALIQEVPPWWPKPLGARLDAHHRRVLTSRNSLLPIRRAIAIRWPDVIKSHGGGSNAILVRRRQVVDHRKLRLCWRPERRWLQGARLEGPEPLWVATLHATAHDSPTAAREVKRAAAAVLEWARDMPVVLGGDFNLRELSLNGYVYVGGRDVDHVFVRGLRLAGPAEVLDRGRLSDHPPLAVNVALPPG